MTSTRRVTHRLEGKEASTPPPPPRPVQVPDDILYKGYQIEPGSYVVGHGAWSPRVVVAVKTTEGAWQRTPLYATSSAKFPTRDEADRRAIDVARAWIDAATGSQRPPEP